MMAPVAKWKRNMFKFTTTAVSLVVFGMKHSYEMQFQPRINDNPMSIWFPKINIICNEERKWHETSMIFAFQV